MRLRALLILTLLTHTASISCGDASSGNTRPSTPIPTAASAGIAHQRTGPGTLIVQSGHKMLAVDADTGAVREITTAPAAIQQHFDIYHNWYAASPDGTRLVHLCQTGLSEPLDTRSLLCMTIADGSSSIIVRDTDLAQPGSVTGGFGSRGTPAEWSPDGRSFAFHIRPTNAEADSYPNDIYVYNLAAGTARRVIENKGHEPYSGVTWAPDSAHFAVQRLWGGRASELIVVDVATAAAIDVAAQAGADVDVPGFVWSTDGAEMAFVAGQGDPYRSALYVVGSDGSGLRKIADGAVRYPVPSWSPDGQWIAAGLELPDPTPGALPTPHLYAIRTDGSEQRMLAGGIFASSIAWSRDGRNLAMSGGPNSSGPFIATLEGPTTHHFGGDPVSYPSVFAWSPDGRRITYTAGGICGQGGCTPGYLYMVDTSAQDSPRRLYPERVDRVLGWQS